MFTNEVNARSSNSRDAKMVNRLSTAACEGKKISVVTDVTTLRTKHKRCTVARSATMEARNDM